MFGQNQTLMIDSNSIKCRLRESEHDISCFFFFFFVIHIHINCSKKVMLSPYNQISLFNNNPNSKEN